MAESVLSLDLHPETRAFFQLMMTSGFKERQASRELSIEAIRKNFDDLWQLSRKVVEYDGKTEELFVPSLDVQGGIPVYVYTPRSVPSDPTILVYYHGGGDITGSRERVADPCKILSSLADCIVVNVEYRLAPEHKFPAMFDDAVAVARWVLTNPTLVGGTQKSKVGVAGDSAGGQLAASVSHDVPGLAFQIPIYSHLSGTHHDSLSWKQFSGIFFGKPEFILWMEELIAEKREDLESPRYNILAHEKYDHLPPTLLIVAEIDQLRDDSYEYSKKLKDSGVDVELFLAKGALHGYFTYLAPFPELCRESHTKAAEFIKKFKSPAS